MKLDLLFNISLYGFLVSVFFLIVTHIAVYFLKGRTTTILFLALLHAMSNMLVRLFFICVAIFGIIILIKE